MMHMCGVRLQALLTTDLDGGLELEQVWLGHEDLFRS